MKAGFVKKYLDSITFNLLVQPAKVPNLKTKKCFCTNMNNLKK